jgi:hypothetical protein
MKKYAIALCSITLIVFTFSSCCTPKLSWTLNVPLRAQETSMWCWAASGQMCMNFLGGSVTQCDEANKRFGRTDCCNNPAPGDCVNGGWPEFEKYNFKADRTSNTALTWDQLKKQLYCSKKPVAYSWHWNGGGGHMMVAIGYAEINNERWVLINDPWAPNVGETSFITYEEYVSGSNHTHWDDFYNITKVQ